MRAFVACLGFVLTGCTGFQELTVGADYDEVDAASPDAAAEPDASEEASASAAPSAPAVPQAEPDAAVPVDTADSAATETNADATAAGASDSGDDTDEPTYDGGKTCCERWEDFLGAPPLQPCAELRCTSVIPPPPPRLPSLLDGSLLPHFDAGFP